MSDEGIGCQRVDADSEEDKERGTLRGRGGGREERTARPVFAGLRRGKRAVPTKEGRFHRGVKGRRRGQSPGLHGGEDVRDVGRPSVGGGPSSEPEKTKGGLFRPPFEEENYVTVLFPATIEAEGHQTDQPKANNRRLRNCGEGYISREANVIHVPSPAEIEINLRLRLRLCI